MCDIQKLKRICKIKKIFLIEDCAEAFGCYYKNHLELLATYQLSVFLEVKLLQPVRVEWSAQI